MYYVRIGRVKIRKRQVMVWYTPELVFQKLRKAEVLIADSMTA